VDPPDRSRALAEKLDLKFPLLSDPKREAIRAYGVEDQENGIAWPAIFVVGRDGKVSWRSLAETYKVRPASEVVLEALDAAAR
jgi:peroxiredoxin